MEKLTGQIKWYAFVHLRHYLDETCAKDKDID